MYELLYSKEADKVLRKIPKADSSRIRAKLDVLAQDPYAPNNNVTKLQNRLGYRLRVGNWRVIYDVNETEIIIIVIKIGSRGEVYQ